MKSRYKKGDIVLAQTPAGPAILPVHHELIERVVVEPTKGKKVGFKTSMDWSGYCGWKTVLVSYEEIKYLKQEWNIPYTELGKDIVFVYEDYILKKVKEVKVSQEILNKLMSTKKIKRGRNGKRKKAKSTKKES